jgi:hypothetical protein
MISKHTTCVFSTCFFPLVTGIKSPQLERDVLWVVEWVGCLATAAESAFGYDGLKRNTYSVARATSKVAVGKYPFTTPDELQTWLSVLPKKSQQS